MSKNTMIENSFIGVLNEVQNGGCVAKLSKSLQDLIQAVKSRNTKGSITLTLALTPASGGDQILITPTVAVKTPKDIERGTIFYPTEENLLQRNDPNQRMLNLQEVPKDETSPREVPQETAPLRVAQ